MTTSRCIRAAAAGALLLLLAACGQNATADTGPAETAPAGNQAVLRVDQTGGLVTPAMLSARLPMVSIYADGRVITEGAQLLIYPGPALPSLQVQRIPTERIDDLIGRARAAGVGSADDLGMPPIADATTTRFTVSSTLGTEVLEVYALIEAADDTTGLTAAQRGARKTLRDLLTTLTNQAGEMEQYVPTALAAVAAPWRLSGGDGSAEQPEVAWPGPALPGELLNPGVELGCVEVSGKAATELLAVATQANVETPWTSGGSRWSVTLRPLLPDESGCADLRAAF